MRAHAIKIGKSSILELTSISLVLLFGLSPSTLAQDSGGQSLQAKANAKERNNTRALDAVEDERRAFAISLVISVADEARSFSDLALRSRVLARCADSLWDADNATARALFRRAWEAAEKGDAEEGTIKTKDNPPPMVIALRRSSGRDLRSEVLTLIARRDRALGEELFTKLKAANERETEDSKGAQQSNDSWSTSEAAARRLHVAGRLLDEGQIERALEFAAPALGQVNPNSIGFLSALRTKNPEIGNQQFAFLLARTEFDPSSDANTVSGLSSYAFTPGFYVTFNADGGSRWRQGDSVSVNPPNLPPALLARFFDVAGTILLRPVPPPDQDFTSSGRKGRRMVIMRLLPLFDRHAPVSAVALRAQLTALGGDPRTADNPLLTDGLQTNEGGNSFERMQNQVDQAKSSGERDSIYADFAVKLANRGDLRAKEISDKIDDSLLRAKIREFVDFQFVQILIKENDVAEAISQARKGQLRHNQRSWAYIQAARLLLNSQRQQSLDLLEEAATEAGRIEGNSADRPIVLVGVATQLLDADRTRAWEMMREIVKLANATEAFTGDQAQITSLLNTNSGVVATRIGGRDFNLLNLIKVLTQEDFYRSLELARSFKNPSPRSNAILEIARATLEKKSSTGRKVP